MRYKYGFEFSDQLVTVCKLEFNRASELYLLSSKIESHRWVALAPPRVEPGSKSLAETSVLSLLEEEDTRSVLLVL